MPVLASACPVVHVRTCPLDDFVHTRRCELCCGGSTSSCCSWKLYAYNESYPAVRVQLHLCRVPHCFTLSSTNFILLYNVRRTSRPARSSFIASSRTIITKNRREQVFLVVTIYILQRLIYFVLWPHQRIAIESSTGVKLGRSKAIS